MATTHMWKPDDIIRGLQKRIAQTIEEAKNDRGTTIVEIAKHLGLTEGSVRHWKYGRTGLRLPHLLMFAKYLGRDPEWLIFGRASKDLKGPSIRVTRIANMLQDLLDNHPDKYAFIEHTVEQFVEVIKGRGDRGRHTGAG